MRKAKIILKYLIILILGCTAIAVVTSLILPANVAPSISFLGGMLLGSPLGIKIAEELSE